MDWLRNYGAWNCHHRPDGIAERESILNSIRAFMPAVLFLILLQGAMVSADELTLKVGAGTVFVNRADSLWGEGEKNIRSLSAKPSTTTWISPFPNLEASYLKSDTKTEYYIGTQADEPGTLTAGFEKKFSASSSFDLYGFYSLMEHQWENPYVLNREQTTTWEYGLKATYENIEDSHINVSYKLSITELNNDVIGRLYPDLQRFGSSHAASVSYQIQPFLAPGISYERGAFKGKSNSYNSFELFLDLQYASGDLALGSHLFLKNAQFDKVHPIFLKRRDESTYGMSVTGTVARPLKLKNYSLIVGAEAIQSKANIDFFTQRGITGFISFEYSF